MVDTKSMGQKVIQESVTRKADFAKEEKLRLRDDYCASLNRGTETHGNLFLVTRFILKILREAKQSV